MKVLSLSDNVYDYYCNLDKMYPGGNAVNVSTNVSKLGYESYYVGNVADDEYGCNLTYVLNSESVDTKYCKIIPNSSTKICLENVFDGEREFLGVKQESNWSGIYKIDDVKIFNQFDVIFTSCNSKIDKDLYKLNDFKGIVSYDFGEKEKYRNQEYLSNVLPYIDIAQFSMGDAELIDIERIIIDLNISIPALFTRGKYSPVFFDGDGFILGTINNVNTIDTMGAGDAYVASFVTGLVKNGWKKNCPLKKEWILSSMEEASKYASYVCTINGGIGHLYSKKNLKAVIFDMDGVIVDSIDYWYDIFDSFLEQYDKTLKDNDRKELYGCSGEKEVEILSRYIDLPIEDIEEKLKDYIDKNQIQYSKYLFDDFKDLLLILKENNIKIAVASSSPLKDINRMIAECQLEGMFDYIVSGEMFRETKPNPEVYLYTSKLFDLDKNEIYVIEDSEYGVEAACNAGLDVLAIRNKHYDFDLHGAKLKFNNLFEIIDYIKNVVLHNMEKK